MNKTEVLSNIILKNGYIKEGYGYKKVTTENVHWITLFNEGEFQMYSYHKDDSEFEKVYDTGVIDEASDVELQTLINVLVKNHE